MGFILDYRKFSVTHLQQVINFAWSIKGSVKVVGRDSFFYLLHFEQMADLDHMCNEGPWAVDGALLILEKLRPNLVFNKLHICFISIWVQFHVLPLEYQYLKMAERLGQIMGVLEKVDWENRLPRNIRFL